MTRPLLALVSALTLLTPEARATPPQFCRGPALEDVVVEPWGDPWFVQVEITGCGTRAHTVCSSPDLTAFVDAWSVDVGDVMTIAAPASPGSGTHWCDLRTQQGWLRVWLVVP